MATGPPAAGLPNSLSLRAEQALQVTQDRSRTNRRNRPRLEQPEHNNDRCLGMPMRRRLPTANRSCRSSQAAQQNEEIKAATRQAQHEWRGGHNFPRKQEPEGSEPCVGLRRCCCLNDAPQGAMQGQSWTKLRRLQGRTGFAGSARGLSLFLIALVRFASLPDAILQASCVFVVQSNKGPLAGCIGIAPR